MNPVDKMPVGIFGPTMCGKTTLARALVNQYEKERGMRAIVLDPHNENWGEHSKVFTNEEKFWAMVWESQYCVVVCEEASTTLRRDREFMPAFTRIRHSNHKLIVCGHHGADLLPGMRAQIGTIYLFLQDPDSADLWARQMCDKRLLAATELAQYEFLRKECFQPPRKMKLSL